MKIKDGYLLREVAGESVVIPLFDDSATFGGMLRLNETGKLLWERLLTGCDGDALVAAILAEYEVDRATAEEDIAEFLSSLRARGILIDD